MRITSYHNVVVDQIILNRCCVTQFMSCAILMSRVYLSIYIQQRGIEKITM